MEKMTFDGLEIEMFTQEPVWQDFLDALAEFYQTQVREPMEGLREIRNISEVTDPNIVLLTLRDLGIDVPLDLILKPERLMKSVYMIPLIYQHSGLDSAWRVIEFILGRRITVTPLWTEDYIDFYPEPYGPLRVDGGTWYKTTHVNMTIQTAASDADVVLPRGSTLKDKLLAAFYSFAPINLVVNEFAFTVDIDPAAVKVGGFVHVHPRKVRYYAPENENPMQIVLPSEVEAGAEMQMTVAAGGVQYFPTLWGTNKTGLARIDDSGKVTFGNVEFDTSLTVFAIVNGERIEKEVTIKAGYDDIRYIAILGPDTIEGGEYADYKVRVFHARGDEEINVPVTLLSPYARVSNNRLYAEDVAEDYDLALRAEFVARGVKYTCAKMVTLKHVSSDLYLTDFSVQGESEIAENSNYKFHAVAKFSDGSEKDVLAVWNATSNIVHVSNEGELSVGQLDVEQETKIDVGATYTFRGVTKKAELRSVIKPVTNPLVSLEIQGPTMGTEETNVQFNCIGIFQDGTSKTLDANWFSSEFHITPDGILEIGSVGVEAQRIRVTASVGALMAEHFIHITRDPIVISSLTIVGPENLNEGNTGVYKCVAIYSDGSEREVLPAWSVVGNPDWVTLGAGGQVLFNDPQEGLIEIEASYVSEGVLYVQRKTIVCIAKTNLIQGLIISGPNLVNAGERIILTATAVYADGTMAEVTPKWTVRTDDANAKFIAADIVGSGVVQARSVDEDMPIIITAKYFQEEVEYDVIVRYIAPKGPDVPERSRIMGPPVFYANEIASFAQLIKFEHCETEFMVSSDWAIDVPDSIASIDENGFLSIKGNREVTVTVTATYSCGGYEVVDSVVVSSIVRDSNYSMMKLYGPETMQIGEYAQLSAEVFPLGATIVEGGGQVAQVTWTVESDPLNIQITDAGLLCIVGPVKNTTLTLKATFDDGFEVLEEMLSIAIEGSEPTVGVAEINATEEALFSFTDTPLNQRFEISAADGNYGFFVYPIVYGLATFKNVDTGEEGGWDGATWPANGDEGTTLGPLTITRNINGFNTQWYVYRTNFPNVVGVFDVTFT